MRPILVPATGAPSAEPSRPSRRWHHNLLNALLFFAALAGTGVLLDSGLPFPDIPLTGEKIRFLSLRGDEFDTIFIGSSRVNFQIIPSLFDTARSRKGITSRSFNAGVLGMRPPEQGFFLERVLREPHERLRWVVIELTSLEARTPPTRRHSARFAFWHDTRRMKLLGTWTLAEWATLRERASTAEAGAPGWRDFLEPLSTFLMHVRPFFERRMNLGRASFLNDRLLLTPSQRDKRQLRAAYLGKKQDGWTSYTEWGTTDRERYRQTYESRPLRAPAPFYDAASDAAVAAMSQAVVEAGATPIFIVPPVITDRQYFPAPAMAAKMIIWSFTDPQRYPKLFEFENRADDLHLNTAGAEQFTLALAERFQELVKE